MTTLNKSDIAVTQQLKTALFLDSALTTILQTDGLLSLDIFEDAFFKCFYISNLKS
jgi:hypothetical protein